MASPTVGNFAVTANAAGSSLTLNIPTSPAPVAGELLVAFVAGEGAIADTMSGWETVVSGGSGNEEVKVFRREATGSDSAVATGGGFTNRAGIVQIVSGWDGVLANVVAGTPATGTLNPSSVDMGASREHLFLAFARNSNNTITGAPTNYANLRNTTTGVHRVAMASRAATTQTEDPGVFAGTNSGGVAGTIGIRPSLAGAAPPLSRRRFQPLLVR
ncbi:MAG: hypothetical protein M3N43_06640 [Actinomycetota bacterium]|nr:hypothetical protein [Actinomycetota bacterium]